MELVYKENHLNIIEVALEINEEYRTMITGLIEMKHSILLILDIISYEWARHSIVENVEALRDQVMLRHHI